MTYNEREIKINNDVFEGGFDPSTGELYIGKALSSSLIIPSEIEIEGKKHTVCHLQFNRMSISLENVSLISFPKTLLTISPSGVSIYCLFRNFSGKLDVPSGLECFLDIKINNDDSKGFEKIFNKYNNAYYFGNKDNPYEYLYVAVSDNITSCSIHKDTKYICSGAFYNCYKLKKILLPDGLKGIGTFAFNYDVIETNEYEGGYYIGSESNPYFAFLYCEEDLDEYYVHKDTKCLLEMPQEETTIYLTSNVTMFPFHSKVNLDPYCNNIRFLGQPEGYVLYGNDCLCKKVNNELLHVLGRIDPRVFDGVKVLHMDAFKHALKDELIIPSHIEYLFDGWYGEEFDSIYLTKGSKLHTFVSKYVHRIPNFYFDGTINDYLDNPAYYGFSIIRQKKYFTNNKGKYDVVKKAAIQSALNDCLKYFDDLEEVVIEDGVEEIGSYAFSNCSNLKEVTIPSSVKKIGYNAFANCTSLKEVHIPEGVIELNNSVFDGASSLEKLYLPKSIKKIGFGLLGMTRSRDLKVTIYYNGTYDEFSKVDVRDRDEIEECLECKEMGGVTYELNKALREFKYPNFPFKSDKCWCMVEREQTGGGKSIFRVMSFNAYKPYILDESAAILKNKQPVEDFVFFLNVSIGVDTNVFKFQYDSIDVFIDNVLSGIENCQDETNEMNPNDYVDVEEIPLYNYFNSLKDNPKEFIKELNAFRCKHSKMPMLIKNIKGYDVAFFANELLSISEENYHNYHSDKEITELLKNK